MESALGQVMRNKLVTSKRPASRGHRGATVVVSVAWVEMRGTLAALRLRELVDTHGTGNVSPLPGAVVGADPIRWTGRNYDSRRHRRTVVIAEVEPLSGAPTPAYMDGIADVAAEFPPP